MSSTNQADVRNHLLGSLPGAVFALVQPALRRVELRLREVLHAPGERIAAAYFPESGYVSLLATLEAGDSAEVGLIGREGVVGMPVVLGTDSSNVEALVQADGAALRMDAEVLRRLMDENTAFRRLMLRYAMAFSTQVTMTAACNGRHLVGQRLARWLLMAHDRIGVDEFAMTHEFLSLMLGVRRASVTVAARSLRAAQIIRYGQGRLQVLNRAGLEKAACECHGIARQEYGRLLGDLAWDPGPNQGSGPTPRTRNGGPR